MKLVYEWLRELVPVTADVETVAKELGLRGFEVASVEQGVIDFEITANRPDCLNHLGLAREASAIWGLPIRTPELDGAAPVVADDAHALDVAIDAPDLCPRYCAQVFDVKIGPSPAWLQQRLEAAGVRPISNVVDVTNYVMLEMGQPMHAFDLERIERRRLVIRRAGQGERLRTLDNADRELDPDTLVIADARHATAVGGVMGGAESEISAKTTTIALESAYFQPASIRRTSRRLGLKTEASTRFERGADINAPPIGIARAAALFRQIGAATPAGPLIDRYPAPRQPVEVTVRASRVGRLLGQDVPAGDVPKFLEPLGFTVSPVQADEPGWTIAVPTFRVDVLREADLIEEIGRHYGFDRLPTRFPVLVEAPAAPDARVLRDRLVRQVLTSAGFSESMTFAFIERGAALPFCEAGLEPTAIANPLSEKFAVLRPSLLPGLIDSCAHNRRRGRKDVQLFEVGSRYPSAGEGRAVGLAWTGGASGAHWSGGSRNVDFFDIKGAVELLCRAFRPPAVDFVPASNTFLVRGRSADVRSGGTMLGVLGLLVPAIVEARGFPSGEDMFFAEIDADALTRIAAGDDLRAEPLPRFPSIVRDISILIDEILPASAVRGTIRASAPPTLASVVEFDRYQGKGVPEGRVSLSLRLTFRDPERTLTDEEAQEATDRIVTALHRAHGAERR